MGRAYKNFWSLNTDEAVVAGILRAATNKNTEVFMPLNAQMKGIDLILVNISNRKIRSVQVKGSRAYEPKRIEVKKYGDGSAGWFFFSRDVIKKARAEYFIFLVYVLEQNPKGGRRSIMPHTISIPTVKLKELVRNNKTAHGKNMYCFFFWVNPKLKKAFDIRDNHYDVSEYLDSKGFMKLNKTLS
jgi:hypothetical protein